MKELTVEVTNALISPREGHVGQEIQHLGCVSHKHAFQASELAEPWVDFIGGILKMKNPYEKEATYGERRRAATYQVTTVQGLIKASIVGEQLTASFSIQSGVDGLVNVCIWKLKQDLDGVLQNDGVRTQEGENAFVPQHL